MVDTRAKLIFRKMETLAIRNDAIEASNLMK